MRRFIGRQVSWRFNRFNSTAICPTTPPIAFVNAAEGNGQIPSFAQDLQRRSTSSGNPLQYFGTLEWADGALVTPLGAAQFATNVVSYVHASPLPSAVVVNCDAGLGRSGMTNVLVRLISHMHRDHGRGRPWAQALYSAYDDVQAQVARLKQARPHAISSFGRYPFIYHALDAYAKEVGSR